MNEFIYEVYKDIQKLIDFASNSEVGHEYLDSERFKELQKANKKLTDAHPEYRLRYESETGLNNES